MSKQPTGGSGTTPEPAKKEQRHSPQVIKETLTRLAERRAKPLEMTHLVTQNLADIFRQDYGKSSE